MPESLESPLKDLFGHDVIYIKRDDGSVEKSPIQILEGKYLGK